MDIELVEHIINTTNAVRMIDGVFYDAEDKVVDIVKDKLIQDTDNTLELLSSIESIYNIQVTSLFKIGSALPTQDVRRYTKLGQDTQTLVYNTFQSAEALGIVSVITPIQKQAIASILPWLEFASKLCDKLTLDVLNGVDVMGDIDKAAKLKLSKGDLNQATLDSLYMEFKL